MANENIIQLRDLTFLLTEIYKFLNGLSSPTINEVFQTNDRLYDLRNTRIPASKHKSTTKYQINTIAFKGP